MSLNSKLRVDLIVPLQQHSYRTAKGLIIYNNLNHYYTSVYNNGKGLYRLLNVILPSGIKKRMHAKNDTLLTPYVKCFSHVIGLAFLFVLRVPLFSKVYHLLREVLVNRCGYLSAKDSCKYGSHIIWSYDTMALSAFKYGKPRGATCVLEMASTSVYTIKEIVESEYSKQLPFSDTLERHRRLYPEKKCEMLSAEFQLADFIVVASSFVRECLIKEGYASNKIRLIPLGIDIDKFVPKKAYNLYGTLRFLFVGRLESAKGIDYIFEVFKQLQNEDIELICVGEVFGDVTRYLNYSPNIRLLGQKRPDEMPEVYRQADIYILPSLWEGFSFSLLEAMASGLPVISTKYSFGPDIVENFKQGFIIEPRDIDDVKRKVVWFINNRDKLKTMGQAARLKISGVSWQSYYNGVNSLVDEINNHN